MSREFRPRRFRNGVPGSPATQPPKAADLPPGIVRLDPQTAAAFHCECGSQYFTPLYRVAFDRLDPSRQGLVPADEAACLECGTLLTMGPKLVDRIKLALKEQAELEAERGQDPPGHCGPGDELAGPPA